jgi:hypothetical protein
MTEKVQKDLLNELENSSLKEIFEMHTCYHNSPEERKYIEDFLTKNYDEKPMVKYKKSLKIIPEKFSDEHKAKIDSARVCAREIIDHFDFEMINNLNDIKYVVDTQIKITESFS